MCVCVCVAVLSLRFSEDDSHAALHQLCVKEHRVRAESNANRPLDRTLFVLNVPPYCTEVRHTHAHRVTRSLTLSLSLSHTHTHTHTYIYTHSLRQAHTHSPRHSLSHTLSLSLTHTHSLRQVHTQSQTSSHTHSQRHTAHLISQEPPNTIIITLHALQFENPWSGWLLVKMTVSHNALCAQFDLELTHVHRCIGQRIDQCCCDCDLKLWLCVCVVVSVCLCVCGCRVLWRTSSAASVRCSQWSWARNQERLQRATAVCPDTSPPDADRWPVTAATLTPDYCSLHQIIITAVCVCVCVCVQCFRAAYIVFKQASGVNAAKRHPANTPLIISSTDRPVRTGIRSECLTVCLSVCVS